MVKYLKDRKAVTNDLEEYANVDSDCEGEPAEADDVTLKEEEKEETHVVLITGSFSACVRLLTPRSLTETTGSPGGNPFSSTAAQTQSCSLPSNRKAQTLA